MKKIIFTAGVLCLTLFIAACHDPYVDPDLIHTVTFSAEGGAFDSAGTSRITILTDAKGRVSNLPTATREETFNFEGWFTTGGTQVTAQTVFHDDALVVARWKNANAGEVDERGALAKFLEVWKNNLQGFEFTLSADETLSAQSLESASITSPITIILNGTQAVNALTLSGFGSLFTVGNNVTLKLRNIQLRGTGSNTASLIDINAGGKVIIENGTLITGNNTESTKHGGGITVNTGGVLEMPAGTTGRIYQNSSAHASDWLSGNIGGGGVWVRGGKFTMDGGYIEENYSIGGGGVLVTLGGEFIMNGGEIYKCISNAVGGGVRVYGYRADVLEIISEENPNAPSPDGRLGSIFNMTGGRIYDNESSSGGGVSSGWQAVFTMTGGTIEKNVALNGGGVYNLYGTFLLYNGGEIFENRSLGDAGGLFNAGRCEMFGGKIYNNETLGNGGGVMHSPSGSGLLHNFFMYAGSITGNTAQGGGGGLYTIAGFDMYDGEISNNTASGPGGGVLVGSPSLVVEYGDFIISAGEIKDNTSYAFGENSNAIAVRGLGKARTAKLGLYWFNSTFQEGTMNFTGGTAVTVPYYPTPKDEGGTPLGDRTLYFIPTPLPNMATTDRNTIQGKIRMAIGKPRVEKIIETVYIGEALVTERDQIMMDVDTVFVGDPHTEPESAKFRSNVGENIIVEDGEWRVN